MFHKIPWFTENHPICFGFVVEDKNHCMVAQVTSLKTIAGTPKRSKSLGDGIDGQNTLSEEFCCNDEFLNVLFFIETATGPSLFDRERRVQLEVKSSLSKR